MSRIYFLTILLTFTQSILYSQQHKTVSFINKLKQFDTSITKEDILKNTKLVNSESDQLKSDYYVALGNFYALIKRDYLNASLNYYKVLEYKKVPLYNKANAYNGLGYVYSNLNENNISVKNYKKSLKIMTFNYKDSIEDILSIYNNIGSLYTNSKLIDSASFYFKKGIKIGYEHNKPSSSIFFNYGYMHKRKDSSYSNTKKAYDIAKQNEDKHMMTFCLLNLGSIRTAQNRIKEADSLLKQCEKQILNLKLNSYLPELKEQQGYLNVKKGNLNSGIDTLKSVLSIFLEKENYKHSSRTLNYLEEAYVSNKDFKNAYHTKLKLKEIDSITTINNKLKNIKVKDLLKQKHLFEIKKAKEKQLHATILILIIIGLIILTLFWWLTKKNKIKTVDKLNKKLLSENELINQQLMFRSLLVNENKEFLNSIIKDIKLLINSSKSKEHNKTILHKLYSDINKNINDNIEHEFEYYFDKVHPNFVSELKKTNVSLTKNEVRLASLIKLNLTTKEISQITKQSTNSINVAKSRLKVKLKLDKKVDLYAYLSKI